MANLRQMTLILTSWCCLGCIPSLQMLTSIACGLFPMTALHQSRCVAVLRGSAPNAMQIAPGKVGSSGERLPGSAVQLLRLSRGLTPAVIQDVAFSASGTLLAVSSARGTTHIYRLALPGQHCVCALDLKLKALP